MPMTELAKWEEFYFLSPFGNKVNHRMQATNTLINCRLQGAKGLKVGTFMPKVVRPESMNVSLANLNFAISHTPKHKIDTKR